MKQYWLAMIMIGLLQSASAAEVIVNITGVKSTQGQVGCLLFNDAEGFPKAVDKAFKKQGQPAAVTVTCAFESLATGTYAVAVSHDKNMNKKLDTNLLGIPKEAWGVSNNVRFKLRPPKFEEAQFTLAPDESLTLNIKLAK